MNIPKRTGLVLLSAAMVGLMTLAGCAGVGKKVMTVYGTAVTQKEYDQMYNQLAKVLNISATGEKGEKDQLMQGILAKITLNKLILNTLIENDARAEGVSVSDEEFKSYKQKEVEKAGGEKQLEAFLEQNKLTATEFDRSLRQQLLMRKLIDHKAGEDIAVPEDQIKAYYQQHRQEFDLPERIEAAHILFKLIEPAFKKELRDQNKDITEAEIQAKIKEKREALKQKADEVFAKVQADPSQFEVLAKKHSEDTISAAKGGDLGYLMQDFTDPLFWKAIQDTEPGNLYPGVLQTMFGYHIIRVEDHETAHQQSLEEAQPVITEKLRIKSASSTWESWLKEKKTSAKIEIEPEFEKKLTMPQSQLVPPQGDQAASQQPAQAPQSQQDNSKG